MKNKGIGNDCTLDEHTFSLEKKIMVSFLLGAIHSLSTVVDFFEE